MSKNKARGTKHETNVVNYLRANGFPHAERRTLSGAKDRGDINAAAGLVIVVPPVDGDEMWDNESGPGGAGNTIRGLTHSLDHDKEGLR